MSNDIKKKKTRIDYLDFAKCIAIILVVLGHTTANLDTPIYRVILYSFHMPLFFLVSGVTISRHKCEYNWQHWKAFLFKSFMTLLVPYLIWASIYCKFTYSNIDKIIYASWQMLGKIDTLTSLWFLPCLFVAKVLAEVILMISWKFKFIERHLFAGLVSIIAFAVGFLLPQIEIGYPLCFDVAFVALGFILLGYATKEILLSLNQKPYWLILLLIVVFGGTFVFGQLIQDGNLYLVLMCKADYGAIWLFLVNALSGTGLILLISILLVKLFGENKENKVRKFMLWIGQNTIGIFILHKPFLLEVVMPLLEKIGFTLPNLLPAIIGTVVAMIFSIVFVWIINRYVPSLFGRFSFTKKIEDNSNTTENEKEIK